MKRLSLILIGLFFVAKPNLLPAQDNPNIPTASAVEVYKMIGEVELKAWIFNPPKHQISDNRPAIVFFFGGGWRGGTPLQFVKQCEYLAARGMVALTVDYRVSSRHEVTANRCVEDARSAIRWMRKHADSLGIDPNRIVAAGGSAGGHLAASTALLPNHDDVQDDLTMSAIPNALALFNPVVVLAPIPGKKPFSPKLMASLAERMGASPESMSPYHHVRAEAPPCIIFHGTADKTVEFETVVLFQEAMQAQENACTLIAYEGEGHGFFNYLRNNNGAFISTMQKQDAFLVELNYLSAPPKVQERR